MNLIQFKQVQGLSAAFAANTSTINSLSGHLEGEIWTIMTGDSTFTGNKTFVGDVVFDRVVTGRSSGNFLGGLWVNTDRVLTQADTGTLFVTTVNPQDITGTKTFQSQGSEDNVIFKGGKVTIQDWGVLGEKDAELVVNGALFITGSDGNTLQITKNSPWLEASSDPANGDLYYSGTASSVTNQVGIGVIPNYMLDVGGAGRFEAVLAGGISGNAVSGKTGFLEELQIVAGLDNYWNSGSLVSPFISSNSGNFSSALTLDGKLVLTGSAGSNTQIQLNNSGSFSGSPNLTWSGESLYISGKPVMTGSSSASTSPGGSNTEVQLNSGGVFGASPNLTWNGETLRVSGNNLTQQVSVPTGVSSSGSPGQISYDNSYFYVCVSTDAWKRTALTSW
jgi:hypothetical protein|tara:strand:+ start:7738 stop:8913 length:1176 start_codon:yes stop_codon:yes gene_type:complete